MFVCFLLWSKNWFFVSYYVRIDGELQGVSLALTLLDIDTNGWYIFETYIHYGLEYKGLG